MLRKVRLYGKLAKFIGKRVLEADVNSAAESVRFLIANFPEVEKHMMEQTYRVQTGGADLDIDELHYPVGSNDIKIIPVVAGAGGRSTWKFIAGAVLIGIAIAAPGAGMIGTSFGVTGGTTAGVAGATTTVGAGFWAGAAAFGGNIGIALVLSGVADLLTPTPSIDTATQDDPTNSFSFSGIQQSSRAGVAVPICYGEVLTGSVVISAEIDVDQVDV